MRPETPKKGPAATLRQRGLSPAPSGPALKRQRQGCCSSAVWVALMARNERGRPRTIIRRQALLGLAPSDNPLGIVAGLADRHATREWGT